MKAGELTVSFGLEKHATFSRFIFQGFPFWEFGSASSLSVSENGYGKSTDVDPYRLQSRSGEGPSRWATQGRQGLHLIVVDATSELYKTAQGVGKSNKSHYLERLLLMDLLKT